MARQSTPPPALNNLYKSDAMVPAYLTEIKYITPYLFVRNSERNSHIPRGVSVQLQTDARLDAASILPLRTAGPMNPEDPR